MRLRNNLYKSWIEISKEALLHNISVFQKITGKNTDVAAVVKANAYGHGLPEVVSILKGIAKVFAVDNIDEAIQVREIDKKALILILGYTTNANIQKAIEKDISLTVYNIETLKKIVSLNLEKTAKIHLKIETGLNRQGILSKELVGLLKYIEHHEYKIYLEGISTHFANIEDTLDPTFAMDQLKKFKEAIRLVKRDGFDPKYIHSAASGATLLYKESHFSLVRIGIALYGLWPSRETDVALTVKKKKVNLKPVLTWKSIVVQTKNIEVGESVGYGRTWFASRKSKIAIIPVGYSDGFDRKLSNIGKVIVGGEYAPVIGRVAMNMITVDVTDIKKIEVEDEVTIIGRVGKSCVSSEDIAQNLDTINYEVVSRINPLLPRIII